MSCLNKPLKFLFFLTFFVQCTNLFSNEKKTEVKVKSTNFETSIESVGWTPDGSSYYTTSGNTLYFWDNKTDKVIKSLQDHNADIISTRLSPDGINLVTIYDDNSFTVQDIVTGKYKTKQKGLSDIPILDAVFYDDYYTLLLPMDGQNLYSFFCLLHTNEALIDQNIHSNSYVYGLDVNKENTHLLITFSDGNIVLFDIKEKKVVQETKSHSIVSISSEFTPDGKYFLYQEDENTLRIKSLAGDDSYKITDFDQPVNTADFAPNGKSVAIGDKNGYIKIYNIAKGYVEDALKLEDGDVAFACDFSPDGKSLLIGTMNGNVIRWEPNFSKMGAVVIPTGVDFSAKGPVNQIIVMEDDGQEHPGTQRVENDPNSDIIGIKVIEKQATDKDVGEYITISPTNPLSKLFRKNIELNPHNIYITAGLGTINSKNFWGNLRIKSGYVNYKPFPFYWGGGFTVETGFTSKDFPYHYRVGENNIGNPILWAFAPSALGGFHYLFEKPNIFLFAEVSLGANIRILASSSIEYPFVGTPTASFFSELAIGAEWKFLRAEVDIQLDTNFVYSVGGTIGAIIKLPSNSKKVTNSKGGSN